MSHSKKTLDAVEWLANTAAASFPLCQMAAETLLEEEARFKLVPTKVEGQYRVETRGAEDAARSSQEGAASAKALDVLIDAAPLASTELSHQLQLLYMHLLAHRPFKLAFAVSEAQQFHFHRGRYVSGVSMMEDIVSVQLFTSKSIVTELFERAHLANALVTSLPEALIDPFSQDAGFEPVGDHIGRKQPTWHVSPAIQHRRYLAPLRDFAYAVSSPEIAQRIVGASEDAPLPALLQVWCKVLATSEIAEIHPPCRLPERDEDIQHVPWELLLRLSCDVFPVTVDLATAALTSAKDVPATAHISERKPFFKEHIKTLVTALYERYKVGGVVFLGSLHRFFSLVMLKVMTAGDGPGFLFDDVEDEVVRGVAATLIERPALTRNALASGGTTAQAARERFNAMACCAPISFDGLNDLDISGIQIATGIIGAEGTLERLRESFEFLPLVKGGGGLKLWRDGEEDLDKVNHKRAEGLLRMVIIASSDVQWGDAAYCLRRELVHRLCTKPCTYSELSEITSSYNNLAWKPESPITPTHFETALKEMAKYKEPKGAEDAKYHIIPSAMTMYDEYHHRLTAGGHQAALEK